MRGSTYWAAVGGFVLLGLWGEACRAGEDQYEYWLQIDGCAELSAKWDFEFEVEMRYGSDASTLYCHNTDSGFVYKGLADWVDVGVSFLREYEKDGEDQWRPENRPYGDVKFKTSICGCALSNRSRLEFRDLDEERDIWRYRNMTKVKFPGEYTRLKLRPYVAEEPFLSIDAGGFKKNRLYVGTSYELTARIEGAVFYLWEACKSDDGWNNAHVLGTNVAFLLK